MRVLITGGTGYIGCHVSRAMSAAGHRIAVLDNLSASRIDVMDRLRAFSGGEAEFHLADIRDPDMVEQVFCGFRPDALVHLAGLKDAAASFRAPGRYEETNVAGSACLLAAAARHGCDRVIFSSSAAVYGATSMAPIVETDATAPLSPYGQTKLRAEALVARWAQHGAGRRRALSLRYFNPCARDNLFAGTRVGQGNGTRTLAEAIVAVAEGRQPALEVFGNGFPTRDGTCQRDFIHVRDVAAAHCRALEHLERARRPHDVYNLGSGTDISVLEFVSLFERISGRRVPWVLRPPRAGDPPVSRADISRAMTELEWIPQNDIADICRAMCARLRSPVPRRRPHQPPSVRGEIGAAAGIPRRQATT